MKVFDQFIGSYRTFIATGRFYSKGALRCKMLQIARRFCSWQCFACGDIDQQQVPQIPGQFISGQRTGRIVQIIAEGLFANTAQPTYKLTISANMAPFCIPRFVEQRIDP